MRNAHISKMRSKSRITHTYVANRGAPDGDFYYPARYRICRISEKNPTGYQIFYQFEYLTYNKYYKHFSHPCISAEEGDTFF